MNKFKIGQKVKIPKTKSVSNWGNLNSSISVRKAKENNQDFMYIVGIEDETYIVHYLDELHKAEENRDGDFFLESDLEAYEE